VAAANAINHSATATNETETLSAPPVDLLAPSSLWDEYATSRGLEPSVAEAGREMLASVGAADRGGAAAEHVHVAMEEVVLEGFGSFGAETSYALAHRGLVLVQVKYIYICIYICIYIYIYIYIYVYIYIYIYVYISLMFC